MRARYKTWTKGSENEEEPRKERVRRAGKAGFSTTEAGGASALGAGSAGGGTPCLDYSLDPVCGDPLPAAELPPAERASAPSLRPPRSALLPCPPAVRLMSWLRRGLMGMPEPPAAPLAAAGKPQRAGL